MKFPLLPYHDLYFMFISAASVQVAFGPGAASSSSSIRTYGVPKVGNKSRKNNIEPEDADDEESIFPLPMDVEEDGKVFDQKTGDGIAEFAMATNAAIVTKTKKDYKEPWVISLSLSHLWHVRHVD